MAEKIIRIAAPLMCYNYADLDRRSSQGNLRRRRESTRRKVPPTQRFVLSVEELFLVSCPFENHRSPIHAPLEEVLPG